MNVRPAPDSPRAWLERAHSDLALARAALTMPDVLLEDACFHAQQCAEKALKALLMEKGSSICFAAGGAGVDVGERACFVAWNSPKFSPEIALLRCINTIEMSPGHSLSFGSLCI